MKGKFHLATVRPRIDVLGNIAFAQGDVLFDWHRFEIPRGACAIKSFNIIDAGKDAAATAGIDMELFFAKSVNGVAPPSIADSNSTAVTKTQWAACRTHIIAHTGMLDASAMENADTYTLSYNVWDQAAVGDQVENQLQPGGIMLEGDPNYRGTTPGYQSIWMMAITDGANDYGTGVLLDQAGDQDAVAKTTTSETTLTVSGSQATLVFAVGDELISFVEANGSTPKKIGKVTEVVSATSIKVDHVEEGFGDDTEICFRAPLQFNFGLEY